jgi:hypothetical protein
LATLTTDIDEILLKKEAFRQRRPSGRADKGARGRNLILPPGHDDQSVPDGYIPLRCDTYRGYALVRSVLASGSDDDIAKAVIYSKRMKLYPLSAAADTPSTKFLDAGDTVFDSTIPYDTQFFESVTRRGRRRQRPGH